jgi:uncharacterized delta-60 repeat protein
MVPTVKEEGEGPAKGPGFEMTKAPGGKIIVRWGQSIYRYLSNGRADLGFGKRGRVAIGTPAGIQFKPADMTVDQLGRVVVVGTSQRPGAPPDPGPNQLAGPTPTWVTAIRYLPTGALDPSFGNHGRIDTTLGMAPPESREGISNPAPIYTYVTPAVSAGAVAIDGQGRLVIAGASVVRVEYCYPGLAHYVTSAYVSRLTEDGAYDVSFANSAIADTQTGEGLTPTPNGGLLVQGRDGVECPRGEPLNQPTRVVSLIPDGTLDSSFGSSGAVSLLYARTPDLVIDPRGRILLLGSVESPEAPYDSQELDGLITRLRADGSLDSSFGRRGQAVIPLRRNAELTAVAVDDRSRPLLVGAAVRRTSKPSWEFQLLRMTARGKIDRAFGARGFVRTRFGAGSSSDAEAVLVDARGRIVAGGPLQSPRLATGSSFALVRYLGGG